jgi:hypothetical protein
MNNPFELPFEFEELNIVLCGTIANGMMLYGTATLEGDEDGFTVDTVKLEHGPLLRRRGNGRLGFPSAFEDELFARIAAVIENPKTSIGAHAEREWNSLVEQMREGNPDRLHDERRDYGAIASLCSADRLQEA